VLAWMVESSSLPAFLRLRVPYPTRDAAPNVTRALRLGDDCEMSVTSDRSVVCYFVSSWTMLGALSRLKEAR
jgi:hypothetical protein